MRNLTKGEPLTKRLENLRELFVQILSEFSNKYFPFYV